MDQIEIIKLVVHELRNPIAAIQGYADLLHEDERLDAELSSHAQIIRTRTREMGLTLAALNDVLRSPASNLKKVETSHLLQNWEKWIKRSPFAQDIQWDEVIRVDVEIPLSQSQFFTIFNQLALNITRFCSSPYQAESGVEIRKKVVTIFVRDFGPGIKKENLKNLTQPFSRHSSPNGKSPGIGLGLAQCRRLVEEASGELRVSCPDDGGTKVEILFFS